MWSHLYYFCNDYLLLKSNKWKNTASGLCPSDITSNHVKPGNVIDINTRFDNNEDREKLKY